MEKLRIQPKAAESLRQLLAEKQLEGSSIRIFVAGFNCSGPSFNLAVDEAKEEDFFMEAEGFTLVTEKVLLDEFEGFEIKFFEDGDQSGIYVEPDKEPESACGSCNGCH